MKRILVFGMTHNPGGMESVIMNYYRSVNALDSDIHFDFLTNEDIIAYEGEILNNKSKIFKITARSKDHKKYKKEIIDFFAKHAKEYDAIWVNVCSLANIDYLILAKQYGIPRRIIHCHNSQNGDSKLRNALHHLNRARIGRYATDFWTCSKDANKWFYGRSEHRKHVTVINNAIDIDKYRFDEKNRKTYRKKLGLEGKFVVGHIGRFHFQKNQLFLLDVFKELSDKKPNAVLVLVGDGDDRDKIESKIKDLNLTDKVMLLGKRDDISQLLCAFDVFVFPSLFEGLSVVLLEAQANNLPIVASDSIPANNKIGHNFDRLSLGAPLSSWSEAIIRLSKNKRGTDNSFVSESGYNIAIESSKFVDIITGRGSELRDYFYIRETSNASTYNASSKARADAETIMKERSITPLDIHSRPGIFKIKIFKPLQLFTYFVNSIALFDGLHSAPSNAVIYIQFPISNNTFFVKSIIGHFKKKGMMFVAIIHDLDYLRYTKEAQGRTVYSRAVYYDTKVLPLFNYVISHNAKMTEELRKNGIANDSIINLGIFDYLADRSVTSIKHSDKEKVIFAGNLDKNKSKFLYELPDNVAKHLSLYGKNLDESSSNAKYCGSFSDINKVEELEGAFGLVWDGTSSSTCEGKFGEYLKYNNPHKASMYIAAGLPIIIWDSAALADFVKKNNIGYTISSLEELPNVIDNINKKDYAEKAKNIAAIREKAISGYYLGSAIDKVRKKIDEKR